MIATNIEQHTNEDLARIFPVRKCNHPDCLTRQLDTYYWGPDGEILCNVHCREAWKTYKDATLRKLHPDWYMNPTPAKPAGQNPFASLKKLSGVQIQYPGYEHLKEGVRSIWTQTRCYPYPNHRKKLGMKKSYETDDCKVLSWGIHQDPTKETTHGKDA